MRIVLDTNVLVSGLLNPYGPPGQIVRMVASGGIALCFDACILGEYREVLLRPKFPFRAEQIDVLLEQIRAVGELVSPSEGCPQRLPDPADEPFLAAAIAGGAAYLVTGNPKHYPAGCRGGVALVSPARFLDLVQARPK
ncbi:MAG: putative toxin-antitoxin system toxin component, PIN family [Thermoguttaceae bacterium]|jgi:putative PIN family toxin of toxin-antitoxin system